jgi:hypothetical protein
MKRIKQIWKDISHGENIDLYVTIVIAIVLTILITLNVSISENWLAPLTLTILALLAYSMLGNRHQIEELYNQLLLRANDVLLQNWPGKILKEDLQNSSNILIIGVSLERTIRSNFALIEKKLENRHKIKVILVDPNSSACEFASNRVYRDKSLTRTQYGIQTTLGSLKSLLDKDFGNLEIRLIDYPLSFGGFLLDPNTPKGVVYLKHYTYRMPREDIPRLIFRPSDEYWYEFYVEQMQILWESSIQVDLAA